MRQIDPHAVADYARLGRFHAITLFWCALIIIFDGYDLAIAGIALPSIMKDMGVTSVNAGFIASAALFGMMFGAIFLDTIADRIGRCWVIAACIVLSSVFTAAADFSTDPVAFSAARFLAGLGIGGVMPNVVAQMTEYSPCRTRSTLITLMFSGYSVSGMLAALLGKDLLEYYGRQSVFIAVVLPVLLVPAILRWMPESVPFLLRIDEFDAVRDIVRRLNPNDAPQPGDTFIPPEADCGNDAPLDKLFQDRHGFSTAMFWIAFFMCLFVVYALSPWLTKLMVSAGYSLGSALTFVLVLNFGAMLGATDGGWLADRFNIKYVLMAMYALAAVSIALLGIRTSTEALYLLVAVAGGCAIGTQIVTYAYAGQSYPTSIRSTDIGWVSGVRHSGAIFAPIVIGMLVGMALPLHHNFFTMAASAVIAMIAVAFINHQRSASVIAC